MAVMVMIIGEVESLGQGFSGSYKAVLENIKTDLLSLFPNLNTVSDIQQLVLAQLVMYYTKFEDILKKCFRGSTQFPDFVPIPTLTYQVTRSRLLDIPR